MAYSSNWEPIIYFFKDINELPISDFYQCTHEGLPEQTLYGAVITDAKALMNVAPENVRRPGASYGKFKGQVFKNEITNLQPQRYP